MVWDERADSPDAVACRQQDSLLTRKSCPECQKGVSFCVYLLHRSSKIRTFVRSFSGNSVEGCHVSLPVVRQDNALALSSAFNPNGFPTVDLDDRQALAYLRKESMALPAGTPRGYVVVTYRNHPLGFVKNIGNRANNLLPQEWRIKSTYLPDDNQNITIFP